MLYALIALEAIATVVQVIAGDSKPGTTFSLKLSRPDIDYVNSRLRSYYVYSEEELRFVKRNRKDVVHLSVRVIQLSAKRAFIIAGTAMVSLGGRTDRFTLKRTGLRWMLVH